MLLEAVLAQPWWGSSFPAPKPLQLQQAWGGLPGKQGLTGGLSKANRTHPESKQGERDAPPSFLPPLPDLASFVLPFSSLLASSRDSASPTPPCPPPSIFFIPSLRVEVPPAGGPPPPPPWFDAGAPGSVDIYAGSEGGGGLAMHRRDPRAAKTWVCTSCMGGCSPSLGLFSWKMKWQLSGLPWGGPWSWEHRSSAARAGRAAYGGLSTMAAPPVGFLAQDDIF